MVRLSLLTLIISVTFAVPSFGALGDGLVGYWQLEEVTEEGDYLDSSGNGLHLRAGERELQGTEPLIVHGIAGNGVQLGSNDFLWSNAAAPISGNAPRTLNVWFMPIGNQTEAVFCWGAEAPGRIFDLYLNTNGMWGGHFYGSSWDTLSGFSDDNPRYTTSDWQMTTLVYDGDVTASVYLNGQFVKSATLPGQLDTPAAAFALGGGGNHGYAPTRDFAGFVDEAALWNRVLTADEIAQAYDLGWDGQPLPLGGGGGIEGDLDGDGMVGGSDLDIVRGAWGQNVTGAAQGDPSGDGVVGGADLDIIRANWGNTAAAVPEPAGVVLLSLLGAIVLIHRHKHG